MIEPCELYKMIPEEEHKRVFSGTAGAELDITFLCFNDPYKIASMIIPKSWTILDLGCAYAAQAYYFRDHKKYIGVDLPGPNQMIRFQTDNMEFHETSIQEYVKENLNRLDLEHTFALCVAVPDKEAQKIAIREFPHHYVWYPGGIDDLRFYSE